MLRLPLIASAVMVAAVGLYLLAGTLGAARKLAALEPLRGRGDYAITLAFPPERFHQLRLQDRGRLVEVRERTVFMKDVTAQSLHDIAREYWVTTVTAWAGQ